MKDLTIAESNLDVVNLVIHPDKRLVTPSVDVEVVDDRIRKMLDNMALAMEHFEGVGLAGVQVGYMKHMFVVDYDGILASMEHKGHDVSKYKPMGRPLFMINTKLLELSKETHTSSEGCLSLPGLRVDVERSTYVKAQYIDYDGKEQIIESDLPLLSACLQHEYDHTHGILIYTRVSKLKRDMAVKKMEKFIASHDLNLKVDPNHKCESGCGHNH